MSAAEFNLPDTSIPPDNIYFDANIISWNFEFDGKKATLGHIQPNFELEEPLPVAEGGERITLLEPEEGSSLQILELGGERKNRADNVHDLSQEGDTAFIPEGKNMWIRTAGKAVRYVCIYPGQPAEE